MAELIAIQEQTVAPNSNTNFISRRDCNKGYIIHREGSGIITLRGIVNNPCANSARYEINYQANIAIPAGGTATTPIAIGIAIQGEVDGASLAISTPGAVSQYNSVSGATIIDVPKGCCYTIALENAPASTEADYVQQSLLIQNANLVVNRIA